MFRVINGCLGLILIIICLQVFLANEIFELIKEIILNLLEIINQFLSQVKQ
jgi:hypothetical protein